MRSAHCTQHRTTITISNNVNPMLVLALPLRARRFRNAKRTQCKRAASGEPFCRESKVRWTSASVQDRRSWQWQWKWRGLMGGGGLLRAGGVVSGSGAGGGGQEVRTQSPCHKALNFRFQPQWFFPLSTFDGGMTSCLPGNNKQHMSQS